MLKFSHIVDQLRAEEKRLLADLEKVRAAISTLARTAGVPVPRERRRGRRFSAVQRKAVSDRMKKLWAERRRKSH
jgi:hypothetical protein